MSKRKLGDSVFDRRGSGNLSRRVYIALISFFTLYGLAVSGVIANYTAHMWGPISQQTPVVEASVDPGQPEAPVPTTSDDGEEGSVLAPVNEPQFGTWAFIVFGLILPFGGIFVALGSDNPWISFLGYNMVVVGFGLILGPCIFMYSAEVIIMAMATTFLLTLALSIMGIIYPHSLEHWGGWLFGLLLAVIIGQFTGIFMGMMGYGGVAAVMDHPIMHIMISILFCAYILYDWNRALRIPHTVDNAIDTAVALYLDIMNLFLHILRLFGQSDSSS